MAKLNLKSIENLSNTMNSEIKIKDFLDIHTLSELFFRRLLYISLRLNDENDKDAKKMTILCSLNSNEILEKAINLIGRKKLNNEGEKFDFTQMKSKYIDFSVFFNYYNNFTSRHRNLYLHGINEDINEKTLKLLCCIESQMLKEIEKILKTEFGKSCIDTPTTWGAHRIVGNKPTSLPQRIENYKLGKLGKSPIKNSSVRKGLKKHFLSC